MELGKKEATFFGIPRLPLVQIPHHPSGGARPGEHRQDAEIAIAPVNESLTVERRGEGREVRVEGQGANAEDR
jgi:hypothetical protein